MVHPSPSITTVNRSAERRRRFEDARWPVARRRILRLSARMVSLSAALCLMLYTFPPLMDAARAHPVIPASFLTAEERMVQKYAAEEERVHAEREQGESAERVQTIIQLTEREQTERDRAAQATDSLEASLSAAVFETDVVPETEPPSIPELVILPPPEDSGVPADSSEYVKTSPADSSEYVKPSPADTEAVTGDKSKEEESTGEASTEEEESNVAEETDSPFLRPRATINTFQLTDVIEDSAVKSQYAVLMDAQTGEIIAERSSDTLINPASMTKVLTLLTAVECLTGPDGSWDLDSYTWNTKEISEYCWVHDCSMAWFTVGEWVPVRDTLYGMILPSGADAALMLANYAAGSQEALVEKMNEKAQEIGLSEGAHFENCVGLYGENHICTVRDMALIMKAAMDHPVCRTVLGKEVWTTSHTEEHPSGILLVNRFLRRIKSEDSGLTVIGAKTGYVRQAGNCAVSMARRDDGKKYICVTAKGPGSSQVIRDHAALYRLFCGGV